MITGNHFKQKSSSGTTIQPMLTNANAYKAIKFGEGRNFNDKVYL